MGRGRSARDLAPMLALCLLAACADPRATPEPPPSPVSFDIADLDHDGTVTADEWEERGQERFSELDADGSGDLDLVELDVAGPVLAPLFDEPLAPELVDRWFARTDTDGDGRISPEEWLVMRRAAFMHADRNQDGRIGRAQANEARYLTVLGS